MTKTCPTCNQPIYPNEIFFEGTLIRFRGKSVRVGPIHAKIFGLLHRNIGRAVSTRQIFDEVYGLDPSGGPLTDNVIKVAISQMRKQFKLAQIDIQIENIWATGYRLLFPHETAIPNTVSSFNRKLAAK